ncbi:iron-containing alcohol dehydrogenase [Defluviimonas aestuarii]|uniref:iron-containing alcohol dehydrogenase n=1 Tax=Albidovulum aestuarii TaxID=1130726 RepID=UPI00249B472B|nr:iron-containing alcohol dehydrogenase [Defluviimonas aestuarii]MDI3337705.1 iron-containing alcohol dehydrogenase [Defluviimonas aestuarii]
MTVGKGALDGIPVILTRMGGVRNPLIVTDAFMVSSGVAGRVQELLISVGLTSAVFDKVLPDPTDTIVLAGIEMLEAGGHDAVIGLGGGSPIDAAKAIAVMAAGSRDIQDYRPPKQSDEAGLPMLAIPTTAGTGSEVTHHAVIIHDATREKISCRGEGFVPTAAIVDYELTLSKPRRLIADNGLDTLTHAIEAYVSRKATLYSDRLALDCMRLVAGNLDAAYRDPENMSAREALMLAATFGGLAFSNASIALVHAMSRPLGSLFHVPHGMSNAMLLPSVTAYSKSDALGRYADCARVIGMAGDKDSDAAAADALVEGLYAYNQRLDVPTLSGFGIDRNAYLTAAGKMAEDAVRSGAPANNPRIGNVEEITDLYNKAWA